MSQIKPLTLDDYSADEVYAALKLMPEQVQHAVVGVCAQIEVRQNRTNQE